MVWYLVTFISIQKSRRHSGSDTSNGFERSTLAQFFISSFKLKSISPDKSLSSLRAKRDTVESGKETRRSMPAEVRVLRPLHDFSRKNVADRLFSC